MIGVAVSIDTEADHGPDAWIRGDPLTFRSVHEGIAERLTPLFRSFGVRPTYLLSSEVIAHPPAASVLRALPDAELGTHLHGDHVEPFARQRPEGTSSIEYQSHYPEDIERAKVVALTDSFTSVFGRRPRAFRAGRYAASGRTARILTDLGYRVDCSVTPGILWRDPRSPGQSVDHRHAPLMPYHPSQQDIARPGTLPILEVPITIVPRPWALQLAVRIGQRLLRRPSEAYPIWLRPSVASSWEMQHVVRTVLRDPQGGWLNVMFHSMEVVAGASPYSRTRDDAERVVRRLTLLLRTLRDRGARFVTLSELAETAT